MIHNKPNHRWIILYNQNKNYTDFLEKLAKDSNSIILIEIPQVAKTHESRPFHKFYVRIISV